MSTENTMTLDLSGVKLTEYSHGAGCGCKLPLSVLSEILAHTRDTGDFPQLLVGNASNDDAAAYDLGNGTCVLSTTDFFMPIVDDPFTFGRIAATNAISDIYAMGGTPAMAIAILGWPAAKLPAEVARLVVDGGKQACIDAGIPLAGGHSIDCPEPIFGLAVTGLVNTHELKRNSQATADCELFLTKPIGIGILTTAQKRKKIAPEELQVAIDAMCTLNKAGAAFAKLEGVKALTDVTGFGLMGHLIEVVEGSGLQAIVDADQVPVLPHAWHYLKEGCVPGGTKNNFKSYGHKLSPLEPDWQHLLCDPQTSGGLLVAVQRDSVEAFLEVAKGQGLSLSPIGHTRPLPSEDAPLVEVRHGK